MHVWCRAKNLAYASVDVATAAAGFEKFGADVIKYSNVEDVLEWGTRDDIIVARVRESEIVLKKYEAVKTVSDYPESLLPFAGRKIWTDTIGNLRRNNLPAFFIKPVREKLFSGRVISSLRDWAPLVHIPRKQEVYCSELIDIRSEYRAFIRNDIILDVRPYYGDYHYCADIKIIDEALAAFKKWEERPAACALDFAVTNDHRTLFLKLNDGYSIEAYGLDPSAYARLLTTRWTQLMGVPDPYALD